MLCVRNEEKLDWLQCSEPTVQFFDSNKELSPVEPGRLLYSTCLGYWGYKSKLRNIKTSVVPFLYRVWSKDMQRNHITRQSSLRPFFLILTPISSDFTLRPWWLRSLLINSSSPNLITVTGCNNIIGGVKKAV